MKSGQFQLFDHGSIVQNVEHYGKTSPPLYNISKVVDSFSQFPSFMIVGKNDALVTVHDFETLMKILEPTGVEWREVPHFTHSEYLLGLDSKEMVSDPTIDFIKRNTPVWHIPDQLEC